MKQYTDLVEYVLNNGYRKENRTGVDTISCFGYHYSIDLREGFPLLTTKEISWKNIVIENLWFLTGNTDIGLLHKHNCHFWDPWATSKNTVPSAYGNFWRKFPAVENAESECIGYNDQIKWAVEELKRNPYTRRACITAWNPQNAQNSALPPCHAFWVLNVQSDEFGEPMLCLHLTQRSADIALGVPYNIAGYSFLLELISRFIGISPGVFSHTLVDAHIYTSKKDGSMAEYDHVPGMKEQITREHKSLPKLEISDSIQELDNIDETIRMDTDEILEIFKLTDYNPHPAIKFKVAV